MQPTAHYQDQENILGHRQSTDTSRITKEQKFIKILLAS